MEPIKQEVKPVDESAETKTMLERAESLMKDIEEREIRLKHREEKMTKEILSGQALVQPKPIEEPPEVKKRKAAMNFFKGSIIEKAIEKHG